MVVGVAIWVEPADAAAAGSCCDCEAAAAMRKLGRVLAELLTRVVHYGKGVCYVSLLTPWTYEEVLGSHHHWALLER
jgi:hypothetical protein